MKHHLALALIALSLSACKTKRHHVESVADAAFGPRPVEREQHAGPDPAPMNVKWMALGLKSGESSTVELDLVNRGAAAAGPFRVVVWTCTDNAITARRQLAGSLEVPGLPLHAPQHVVVPFTAPTEKRGYVIALEVDDLKQVAGDDRDNNRSATERLWVQ